MGNWIKDKNAIWVNDSINSSISYPDDGNISSFSVEENSFWFRHRNEILLKVFERFPFSGNFADIGGGNGYQAKMIAEHFKEIKTFLIEPGYSGCLNATKRGLTHVYNTTAEAFNFSEHQVGAVGIFDVLEHIKDDVNFLTNLKSKLPEKSLIYITVPAYTLLWSDVDDYGGHYKRYTIKMIKKLCNAVEMELLFSSYFFCYIPLLTFMLRSIPYRIRGPRKKEQILDEEASQHNPSNMILNIFQLFNNFELNKIEKSNIKFGASCLAVLKS